MEVEFARRGATERYFNNVKLKKILHPARRLRGQHNQRDEKLDMCTPPLKINI